MSAEWDKSNRNRDTNIDTNLTAVCISCKLAGIVSALGINNRAVCIWICIHNCKSVFKILASLNAENRTEYFVTADSHILSNMVKNCRSYKISVFIALRHLWISSVKNKRCALVNAFLNISNNLIIMLFVCDRT